MSDANQITVTLGAHEEVPVYGQRHAWLTNQTVKFMQGLIQDGDLNVDIDADDPAGFINFLGARTYQLLCICIPAYGKRCKEYEFMGYGFQEAYEKGEYDESEDKSPTLPEILSAFEVAKQVNRFDVFKVIFNIIEPKMIKAWINARLAERLSSSAPQNLRSIKGGSDPSTSSGTSDPTSPANEA
jgi:hypothetical protein